MAAGRPRRHAHCHKAMLPQCHGATVPRCHNATLPQCHGAAATLPRCHGAAATLPRCHVATLSRCHVATLSRCHVATLPTMPRCHNATLPTMIAMSRDALCYGVTTVTLALHLYCRVFCLKYIYLFHHMAALSDITTTDQRTQCQCIIIKTTCKT